MKKEEMLNAVGQIDDKYIEEADEVLEAAETERAVVETKAGAGNYTTKGKNKRRGKWAAGLAAVLVVGLSLGVLIGDSGFLKAGSSAPAADNAMTEEFMLNDAPQADEESMKQSTGSSDSMSFDEGLAYTAEKGEAMPESYDQSEVKLIYRADVGLQTTDFEKAAEDVKALVEKCGGYFESTEVNNGGYFSDQNHKSGCYVVRVPQAKYRDFLDSVAGTSHVVYLNETVEDVGQEYFETESRLETLRIKQERLQDLMKNATQMSDIIELENALSNTEYEIEMYTSTLNRYDSLIGFSTITINLEKVVRYDNGIDQDQSFFARLGQSLKDGAEDFLYALDSLVNWISYNLITLIIIIAVVIVMWKRHWVSRIRNWWQERGRK